MKKKILIAGGIFALAAFVGVTITFVLLKEKLSPPKAGLIEEKFQKLKKETEAPKEKETEGSQIEIGTIISGERKVYSYTLATLTEDGEESIIKGLAIILGWEEKEGPTNATFKLSVYGPEGNLYEEKETNVNPIIIEVPNPKPGKWEFAVEAIDIPYDNYPIVIVIGEKYDEELLVKREKEKWKILGKNTKVYGPYYRVEKLVLSGNNFAFRYVTEKKEGKLNINGKIYPYYPSSISLSGKNFAFVYSKDTQRYANINGRIFGPYKVIGGFLEEIALSENNFGFRYLKEGNWYLNINDKIYGPYLECPVKPPFHRSSFHKDIPQKECERVWNPSLSENNFGFRYKKGSQYYLNINNKIYGGYEYATDPIISGNNFGFMYKEKGQWYLNINNKIAGPYNYEIVGDFSLVGKNFGFSIREGNQKYFNINGKRYGPYKGGSFALSEETFALSYWRWEDNKWYARIHKKTYGPYEDVSFLSLSNNIFAFAYSKGLSPLIPSEYINVNGKIYGPFERVEALSVSGKSFAFSYKERGKSYAVIKLGK